VDNYFVNNSLQVGERILGGVLMKQSAWDNLPNGWTQDSVDKFWDSLTGDRKHKVTECMKKMEGHVDNTGAFCGSLGSAVGYRAAAFGQVPVVVDDKMKDAVNDFVDFIKSMMQKYYSENFKNITMPEVTIDWGSRYAKIVKSDGVSRSVYGFIDLINGDLLKAAGWKTPARGARGNVLDKNSWKNAITPHGMVYFRSASVVRVADRYFKSHKD
jgi:hypothetical protein